MENLVFLVVGWFCHINQKPVIKLSKPVVAFKF